MLVSFIHENGDETELIWDPLHTIVPCVPIVLSRYLPRFFQGRWQGRKILSSLSGGLTYAYCQLKAVPVYGESVAA